MVGKLLRVATFNLAAVLTVAGCGSDSEHAPSAAALRAAEADPLPVPDQEPLASTPPAVSAPTPEPVAAAAPESPVLPLAPPRQPALESVRAAPPAPKPVKRASPAQPGGLLNRGGDRHAVAEPREIGVIEIPKLRVVHPIVEGIELSQLHWGPGHWPGTAMPGQNGNVVFAGHRVTHTRPFLDIDLLLPGDRVIFKMPDGAFTYEVTHSQVVSPSAVHIVDQTPDPTMTLFACHPKHSARQRYVVHGRFLPGV